MSPPITPVEETNPIREGRAVAQVARSSRTTSSTPRMWRRLGQSEGGGGSLLKSIAKVGGPRLSLASSCLSYAFSMIKFRYPFLLLACRHLERRLGQWEGSQMGVGPPASLPVPVLAKLDAEISHNCLVYVWEFAFYCSAIC